MEIRKATVADVPSIVSIHCSAFKDFFLTSLGPQFLRFYYGCFIRSEETVTLVAVDEQEIVGFAASTEKCKGFNSRLIKNNFLRFAGLSIRLLFTSPKSLIRLAKNLTKKSDSVEDNEEYAELYSIGVQSDQQGKGVGKLLLSQTECVMRADGVSKVSLTTDYYHNDAAVGFYHSMGYETLYEFVTYPDRKMYRLIKNL